MKINTRARYALRMMLDINKHGTEKPVPLRDVAERQDLSKRYLDQLAMALRNASLLRSVPGMRGGYNLARPANEITLLDIIQSVDGPVDIIDCLGDKDVCNRTKNCECRSVWGSLNNAIINVLSNHNLEDLSLTEE